MQTIDIKTVEAFNITANKTYNFSCCNDATSTTTIIKPKKTSNQTSNQAKNPKEMDLEKKKLEII